MEYMAGGSLQNLLKEQGAFHEEIIKNFAK
jgi:hypothetical protein